VRRSALKGGISWISIFTLAAVMLGGKLDDAQAQEWPNRPVTVVVPFGPGGSNDLIARALADALSRKFSQPFVVENRAGAGGFVGTRQVSSAAPDGYTLLVTASGISTLGKSQHAEFDATRDVTPIAMIAKSPTGIEVPGSLPVHSVKELIEYAKKNPDNTFYGTVGLGTTPHLHAELFNFLAGTKVKPVSYKSSAEAQTDLMAGRIHMMFVTVAGTLGPLKSGQLRLLAYTNNSAAPGSPPAPTVAESGVKGFDAGVWWGLFGPKGLPAAIQVKLNEAVVQATADARLLQILTDSGASATKLSADEFTKDIVRETIALEQIIKDANIKFE
jgi:tripartite-type tricarboxylate transporter receptor subunit TctC